MNFVREDLSFVHLVTKDLKNQTPGDMGESFNIEFL